ncbi:protein CLEC16A homolog isoform X2 [Neocloeon triangulifer]|uniref:protein CLEC16A homolog isoform X2 n=1 Tax=Neocloeon triangulifer TaxID=2078957 RepID=UPI00286F4D33|nr:protein CLEC16A homolog isoform X2 [Neocloeon triangulifer]
MSRSWFGGGLWKPKNPHSLEHLKYLYNVLSKNQTVSENNRGLLVETLRSIAEILIWGDQNDGSVFDFFLEKNMLSFFLKIMKQKCGSYVCVQLLQTLNILFENIRNETSLYYLLSNNHVNSIIVHKFDFSDEEVMAYYISFLKTLSFKLNTHTIHFFYNEHTNDFPLYTEAIKFFNHSESMVRIAVRTLTLNVYRVDDKSMLKFIGDRTAAPYFSNLVWFIGNHVLELDNCVRNDADHQSKGKLADLVAEHLDHLHYLNDILCLEIGDLNCVLTDQLLHRLLMPLYVLSLAPRSNSTQESIQGRPYVSRVVALFLLSQVFLIITHAPLVHTLAWIILSADSEAISDDDQAHKLTALAQSSIPSSIPKLEPPPKPTAIVEQELSYEEKKAIVWKKSHAPSDEPSAEITSTDEGNAEGGSSSQEGSPGSLLNITDEEKEKRRALNSKGVSLVGRPFLEAIFGALDCSENDFVALFALCLLYSMGHNKGVNEGLLDKVLFPAKNSQHWYNGNLIERLIHIISLSCQMNSKVRLVSLEMSIGLLQQLVLRDNHSFLHDGHLAAIEGAREESTGQLRTFYKSDEIFLDMFEEECHERKKGPLNVEWLMMDSNILLPPTGTPMTGIEFSKRLPCGEGERTRRTIRAFLLVRELSQSLGMGSESHLPLTNPSSCVQVDQVLDLSTCLPYNSDLIACTVVTKDGQKIRRFLVIDVLQLILVEPDTRRLGWGVAKFVGFLQDLEVTGDKDDSRCLHIIVHRPLSSNTPNRLPLLSAKFVFDDHIRCMAAKQRLTKGRNKARQKKMQQIARLLDIPANQTTPSPPTYSLQSMRLQERASRSLLGPSRPMFSTAIKAPGFAAAVRREESGRNSRNSSPSSRGSSENAGSRSRDGSPKMPRPRSEEIPLEDIISSSQEGASSTLPQLDPTSQPNTPINTGSSQQSQVGRGATRRRHMEASRRLLSPSPRRASESPSRLAQAPERSSSPLNTPSATPPVPSSHPETETSFMELPLNPGDQNGNPCERSESTERKKKKGTVEII